MLIFCHLFLGVLIGLMLYQYLRQRIVVIMTALGSVLPDVIDKPIGHILMHDSINNGRIYAHTLLFLLALTAVGLIVRRRKGSWAVLAVAAGVASHDLLDSMWENHATFFYPLFGNFDTLHLTNYIVDSFWHELTSLSEWLFALCALAALAAFYSQEWRWKCAGPETFRTVSTVCGLLLIPSGAVIITAAVLGVSTPFSYYDGLTLNLTLGSVSLFGGTGMVLYHQPGWRLKKQ